jgi:hypothetical protein
MHYLPFQIYSFLARRFLTVHGVSCHFLPFFLTCMFIFLYLSRTTFTFLFMLCLFSGSPLSYPPWVSCHFLFLFVMQYHAVLFSFLFFHLSSPPCSTDMLYSALLMYVLPFIFFSLSYMQYYPAFFVLLPLPSVLQWGLIGHHKDAECYCYSNCLFAFYTEFYVEVKDIKLLFKKLHQNKVMAKKDA